MNGKSDVKAKAAFKAQLEHDGYTDVEIVSSPADIRAVKDDVVKYFEIKMTKQSKNYFGAATFTEWEQAFKDPDNYRFVIVITNNEESSFKFIQFTPEQFLRFSTIPPLKVYFNIDLENPSGQVKKSEKGKSLRLSKKNFSELNNTFKRLRAEQEKGEA